MMVRRDGTALGALAMLSIVSCGLPEGGKLIVSGTGGVAGTSTITDSGFGGGSAGAAGGTGGTGGTGGEAGGAAGAASDASTDGSSTGGTAGQGGDAGSDAATGRVTNGLVLLYEFEEGAGNKVADTSGFGAPYDLTISDPNKVSWGTGYLEVLSGVRVESPAAATKLVTECKKNHELTVEAWAEPKNTTQGTHSRVFSHSKDANQRNFSLLQMDDTWGVRLRTTTTNLNGTPELQTGKIVTTSLAQIVFTRASSGSTAIYVDASLKASGTFGGDFSNWDTGLGALAANEFTDPRPWAGKLHLLAVYCRALSAGEVQQNHAAGP